MGRNGHQRERGKGFTIVELLIAVAIVSVLAGVALPVFRDYVRRAQLSGGPVHVKALIDAEMTFFNAPRTSAAGAPLPPCFLFVNPDGIAEIPPLVPISNKRSFPSNENTNALGFYPGDTYFSFQTGVAGVGGNGPGRCVSPDDAAPATFSRIAFLIAAAVDLADAEFYFGFQTTLRNTENNSFEIQASQTSDIMLPKP